MKTYFLDVLMHHYVDFSGRATRKQFWLFVVLSLVVSFVLCLVLGFLGKAGAIITSLIPLILLLPSLAIGARRLRDGGFSPWLWLLVLIPGIGGLILLVLWCLPSK